MTTTIELTAKDFKSDIDPDWCPGCGHFGALNSLQRACADVGLQPHEVVTVSGIGCSSNAPGYINTYGMHTLHGRSLAFATGVKMANHELTVIATGGDGDGYGIGGNHFTHTARRNVDITYVVMNNQIYGLTTGQVSPTSRPGLTTKSTPFGNIEYPFNPIASAIMNGATYVARGYSGDIRGTTKLIADGIRHKGFSIIDIHSPCVTFNLENTHDFFKQRITKLETVEHNTGDWKQAIDYASDWDEKIYTGLFFEVQSESLSELEPILREGGPISKRPLALTPEQADRMKNRLM